MLKDSQIITLECVFGFMRSDNFILEDMISSVSLNTGDTWSQLPVLSKGTNASLDQCRSVRHEAFHTQFCVLFRLLSSFSEDMSSRESMLELRMWNSSFPFQNYFQDLSCFQGLVHSYEELTLSLNVWFLARKSKLDFYLLLFLSWPLISGVDNFFFFRK